MVSDIDKIDAMDARSLIFFDLVFDGFYVSVSSMQCDVGCSTIYECHRAGGFQQRECLSPVGRFSSAGEGALHAEEYSPARGNRLLAHRRAPVCRGQSAFSLEAGASGDKWVQHTRSGAEKTR